MNFVLGIPKNKKGNDSIFVVVDRISNMENFIPCKKEINAKGIIALFFKEIVRLHGFSKTITLNTDTKFIGNFWRNLWNYFGYKVIVHLCIPSINRWAYWSHEYKLMKIFKLFSFLSIETVGEHASLRREFV